MDTQLYRQQYDFELDQKAQISASTNIPVTAATFIFGGLAAISVAFNYGDDERSTVFIGLVSLAVAALGVGIYYIFRSMLGYRYRKLPPLSKLNEYRLQLDAWHQNNGSSVDEAAKEFEAYLISKLADAADHNSQNNINRSNYIHRATFSLGLSVIFVGAAAGLFLYQNVQRSSSPHEVKIIGDVSVVPRGEIDE